MNWLQSQNSPSLQLPLSSPCSCLASPHMEDHRFPAGRNGLTQISFTNRVPASWGSPCGFFPCQQVQAPQFSRPQCHTCPFPLFGPTVDEFWRTPAPYAAPSFPCAVRGGLASLLPPPRVKAGKPLTSESLTTRAQTSRHANRTLMVARLGL